MDEWKLTDEQLSAIRSMRRACKKANAAGLVGFGQSGNFFVYPQLWDVIENGHVNALPYECHITGFHCDGGDT